MRNTNKQVFTTTNGGETMRKTQIQDVMNPTLESIQEAWLEADKFGRIAILSFAQGCAYVAKQYRNKETNKEEEKKEE